MLRRYQILCLLGFLLIGAKAYGQKDTLFWFVAPEAAQNHGDRPILFRFATFGQAATITIEQPANPGFPIQTLNLGPNAGTSIDLTAWIGLIENNPPNAVLNKGFKIRATSPITAYYEINPGCNCNPDIFTLKGKNALGTQFLLPFQNYLNNASYARSGFDIVATENNTTITITPTKNIVGHNAGTPFTIVLNRGQTWNGRAASTAANQHLEGTIVNSDKPIAITINDDSMSGAPYGGCADIMGDQIVPIALTGDEYIVVKGYLNGPDKVYVLGTQNGTTVTIDGNNVATIQAGQTYVHTLSNPVAYIQTSAPAYLLHTTGFGCEVGGALLPTIECTGSSSVSFVRSTNEFFALNIIVQTGGQGNFTLNGNPTWVPSGAFSPVPGSNGAWMYAQINLSGQVPVGLASRLTNSSHLFHMGIVHGGGSSGCRYGYFSDYNTFEHKIISTQDTVCAGDPFLLQADRINGATYNWSGPNNFTGSGDSLWVNPTVLNHSGQFIVQGMVGACPVTTDTFNLLVLPVPINPVLTYNAPLCPFDNLQLQAQSSQNVNYSWIGPAGFSSNLQNPTVPSVQAVHAGTYQAVASNQLCESDTVSLLVQLNPTYRDTQNVAICQGDSVWLQQAWQNQSGTYTDQFTSQYGCDSIWVTHLQVNPTFTSSPSVSICKGQSHTLPDGQTVQQTGQYLSHLYTLHGCDSLIQTQLTVNDTFRVQWQSQLCQGDSLQMPDLSYRNQAGIYVFPMLSSAGCDSTIEIDVVGHPVHQTQLTVDICAGQNHVLPGGQSVTQAGSYVDTLSAQTGCDSVITTQVNVWPVYHDSLSVHLCRGQQHSLPDGAVVSQTGTYSTMLSSAKGCDSLITTLVLVSDTFVTNLNAAICQGDSAQLSNGQWVHQAGTYNVPLSSLAGCDSVVKHHITLNPVYQIPWSSGFCQGDSIQLPDQTWHHSPGNFNLVLTSHLGCDSTFAVSLVEHPTHQWNEQQEICQGSSYNLPSGQTVSTGGSYLSSLQTSFGCDSLIQTQLQVWPSYQQTLSFNLCTGDQLTLPNGQTVQQPGNYQQFYTTVQGCDSNFTYQVIGRNNHQQNQQVRICEGETWTTGSGPQNQSGTYIDSLSSVFGCDSIYTTELLVERNFDSLIYRFLCRDQSLEVNGVSYALPGEFVQSQQTAIGCDSIWRIHIEYAPLYEKQLPEDTLICDQTIQIRLDSSLAWVWNHGPMGHRIEVQDTGWYAASAIDPNGCYVADSIWVKDGCRPTLYVPNTFTPNGDGRNDHFRAYGTRIKSYRLRIFNRWGEEIFQTEKLTEGWNGTHQGLDVPVGVYTYRIDYEVYSTLPYQSDPIVGKVKLVR